jgi:GTP cyclohydrolase I
MNPTLVTAHSNGPAAADRLSQAPPGARRPVDRIAAERAAADLLVALGADPDADGVRDTPRRMAAAFAELLTPQPFNLTTFPNEEGYDELVVVREIPFQSL